MSALVLVCVLLASNRTRADDMVDYFEIKKDPVLNLIRIEARMFFTEASHQTAKIMRERLASEGTYIADGKREVRYVQNFMLDDYKIKAKLTILPPCKCGTGGAQHTARVEIRINGLKKVDIPLGHYPPYGELNVKSITLFPNGVIHYDIAYGIPAKVLLIRDHNLFDSKKERRITLDDAALENYFERQSGRSPAPVSPENEAVCDAPWAAKE